MIRILLWSTVAVAVMLSASGCVVRERPLVTVEPSYSHLRDTVQVTAVEANR